MLMNKKTWRCTLEGCAFFVHLGLAHVLEGKSAVCWTCGEVFTVTAQALKDEMPNCDDCRHRKSGEMTLDEKTAFIEQQLILKKSGVKSVEELPEVKRKTMQAFGLGLFVPTKKEEHAPDCDTYAGGECSCK
jgi:hypothetical protein